MAEPHVTQLVNLKGASILFKSVSTGAVGFVKKGYFADGENTKDVPNWDIPKKGESPFMYVVTTTGMFQIWYSIDKDNHQLRVLHIQGGSPPILGVQKNASVAVNVDEDGDPSLLVVRSTVQISTDD